MTAAGALAALAEPRRQAMLMLVRDEPRSVNDIAAQFDISQQAVSQHLRVLREAGLVEVRPAGRRRLYAVRPEGLAPVQHLLAELWPEGLDQRKEATESPTPRR